MADRFDKLATGNNNWSSVNTWKATTGGATGASVPTSSDNVYVNADSCAAGATLTVDATGYCLAMDWRGAGATNTPTLDFSTNYLVSYGDITFIGAMTISARSGYTMYPRGVSNFTTAGQTIPGGIAINNAVSVITLLDSLTCGYLIQTKGGLDTNGQTLTATDGIGIVESGADAKTLTTGSSVISCVLWSYTGTNLTMAANTATINCSGDFNGGDIATYNIVNLTGATSTISGSNTFAELNGDPAITQTLTFTDGTTQTATTFTLSGSAGHIHTLQGTGTAGWSLVQA